jgi:hypothetical protein
MRFPETFGVWGGMSEEERDRARAAPRDLNRHRRRRPAHAITRAAQTVSTSPSDSVSRSGLMPTRAVAERRADTEQQEPVVDVEVSFALGHEDIFDPFP